ncbi:MAG: hypothetical protein NTW87_04300 [Planctomycetota bacterium]|nr:hypothetical protein [Planctomycetota bacterium]
MADTQDVTTPAPAASGEVEALRRRAEEAERELALRRALMGIDWFDPEDAYRELAPLAERDAEGNWQVVWPDARAGSGTQRLPVTQAARELAARKPHWVRARVLGGSGAGGGEGGAGGHAAGITYAELLKPGNAEKLREYLHERPEELERLRQSHFGF